METGDRYPAAETGLVLVDPLNDFLADEGKVWPEVREVAEAIGVRANLARLLVGARARGLRVFYALHRTDPWDYRDWRFLTPAQRRTYDQQRFQAGSWGADVVPNLAPRPEDVIATPHKISSGFAGTDLDRQLRQHGVQRVVLAGMLANTCVESTGRYALELGYHVTFLKDAVAARSWEAQRAAIEVNYPFYGHAVLMVDEFLGRIDRV